MTDVQVTFGPASYGHGWDPERGRFYEIHLRGDMMEFAPRARRVLDLLNSPDPRQHKRGLRLREGLDTDLWTAHCDRVRSTSGGRK